MSIANGIRRGSPGAARFEYGEKDELQYVPLLSLIRNRA